MSRVWSLDMPTTDKMVLLALADAANDEGITWIALASKRADKLDLLKKCSLSERAIQGAIKRLCDHRFLTRLERTGRGVIYTVYPAGDAPPQEMRGAGDAPTPAAGAGKPSLTVTTTKRATRLSDDFVMPEEWIEWAIKKRHWSRADTLDEAEKFANWWQAKGGQDACKLDWYKTWQVWVANSKRPNGTNKPTRSVTAEVARAAEERTAAIYERMGRTDEAAEIRRKWGTGPPGQSIGDVVKRMGMGG